MIYMFLSNNPSSGDINLSNLSCLNLFCREVNNFYVPDDKKDSDKM